MNLSKAVVCCVRGQAFACLFPGNITGSDSGKYISFWKQHQKDNEKKIKENVRIFWREYTHLQRQGYVPIRMQSVQKKILNMF